MTWLSLRVGPMCVALAVVAMAGGCSSLDLTEEDRALLGQIVAQNVPEEYRPLVLMIVSEDLSAVRNPNLADEVVSMVNAVRESRDKEPLGQETEQQVRGAISAVQLLAVMHGIGAPSGGQEPPQ